MDISQFLASMQTNPADRALARNTRVQAGIPDADMDPTTQNVGTADDYATSDQDAMGGMGEDMTAQAPPPDDQSQGFEDGGEVDGETNDYKWEQLPESNNIEDRRGENPPAAAGGMDVLGAYKSNVLNEGSQPAYQAGDAWNRITNKLGSKFFDEGGPVEEDPQAPPAIPMEAGEDMPGEMNDEPPAGPNSIRQVLSKAIGSPQEQKEVYQEGADSWKNSAMEGITAAMDYGYNTLHGVNRGMSGGEHDPEHKASVSSLFKGDGAISKEQWDQALFTVDPENAMDDSSRHLKALGKLQEFYGAEDPQKGAAAVWAGLQHSRRDFNASAAAATAAADAGKMDSAAVLASRAFNKVPDGTITTVTPATASGPGAEGEVPMPRARPKGAAMAVGASAPAQEQGDELGSSGLRKGSVLDDMLGKEQETPVDTAATQKKYGIPDDVGNVGPSAKDPLAGQKNKVTVGAQQPGGKYNVVVQDPENKKTLLDVDLSPEQLKHALADGFDKMMHRGTVEQINIAALQGADHKHLAGNKRTPWWEEGYRGGNIPIVNPDGTRGTAPGPGQQQQRPQAQQQPQRPPIRDALEGVDTRGMTVSEIAALRKQAAAEAVRGRGAGELRRMQEAGHTERTRMTNTSKENIAGMPARPSSAPGQESANRRAAMTRAAADTKAAQEAAQNAGKPMTPEAVDAYTRQRMQHWLGQVSGQQQPQQQPQQPQQPQQDPAHPPQSKDGHNYVWNPNAISPKTGQKGAYTLAR